MKPALRGPSSLCWPGSALAQPIVSELRVDILAHDVALFGEPKEHGAEINGELQLRRLAGRGDG